MCWTAVNQVDQQSARSGDMAGASASPPPTNYYPGYTNMQPPPWSQPRRMEHSVTVSTSLASSAVQSHGAGGAGFEGESSPGPVRAASSAIDESDPLMDRFAVMARSKVANTHGPVASLLLEERINRRKATAPYPSTRPDSRRAAPATACTVEGPQINPAFPAAGGGAIRKCALPAAAPPSEPLRPTASKCPETDLVTHQQRAGEPVDAATAGKKLDEPPLVLAASSAVLARPAFTRKSRTLEGLESVPGVKGPMSSSILMARIAQCAQMKPLPQTCGNGLPGKSQHRVRHTFPSSRSTVERSSPHLAKRMEVVPVEADPDVLEAERAFREHAQELRDKQRRERLAHAQEEGLQVDEKVQRRRRRARRSLGDAGPADTKEVCEVLARRTHRQLPRMLSWDTEDSNLLKEIGVYVSSHASAKNGKS